MSLFPLGLISQGGGAGGGSNNALTLISTQLISSTTATVTFSGIVSTYKHLQLRITAREDSSYTIGSVLMRFNSDSGSNYSWHRLQGSGGSVTSSAIPSQPQMSIGVVADSSSTANVFGMVITDILDYSNTNKNKTVRSLAGNPTSSMAVELKSGAWYNTSAITSISIIGDGSFVSGSRFSLYGVS